MGKKVCPNTKYKTVLVGRGLTWVAQEWERRNWPHPILFPFNHGT